MKKIVLLFIVLISFQVFADKPKLAVMNFIDETDGKLSKDLVRNGSKLIRSRFTRNAKQFYDVVTDRENEAALAAMKKESQRSDHDRDFQIELGKQVSAAKIVMSTIGALDKETFLITSTLTDVKRGIDETSADAVFDGTAKSLMDAVDQIIGQLLEGGVNYNEEEVQKADRQKTAEIERDAETESQIERVKADSREILDNKRKEGEVEWSLIPIQNKTWNEAAQYCSYSHEGGHNDWRLPTIDEIRTMVVNCPDTQPFGMCKISHKNGMLSKRDYNKKCGGCRNSYIKLNGKGWFWTSSGVSGTNHFWVISSKNTKIHPMKSNAKANAYCVR